MKFFATNHSRPLRLPLTALAGTIVLSAASTTSLQAANTNFISFDIEPESCAVELYSDSRIKNVVITADDGTIVAEWDKLNTNTFTIDDPALLAALPDNTLSLKVAGNNGKGKGNGKSNDNGNGNGNGNGGNDNQTAFDTLGSELTQCLKPACFFEDSIIEILGPPIFDTSDYCATPVRQNLNPSFIKESTYSIHLQKLWFSSSGPGLIPITFEESRACAKVLGCINY